MLTYCKFRKYSPFYKIRLQSYLFLDLLTLRYNFLFLEYIEIPFYFQLGPYYNF